MSEGSDITKNTNISSIVLALAGYVVLFAGKLITYFFTKITVLYAEALHSLADVIIAIFLLIALVWSRKPADKNYRFGYGRAQNVAALVAATIFISFTSIEAFREAIPKLISSTLEMHTSNERQQAWSKVEALLDGKPTPHFYEVVITSDRKK